MLVCRCVQPRDYDLKIRRRMTVGYIMRRLYMGEYATEQEMFDDALLCFNNCLEYWDGRPDGVCCSLCARACVREGGAPRRCDCV